MVACHARKSDVGPVYREVHHGRSCAAETLDAIGHRGVCAKRHECAIAAPDGRLVSQAILYHQVPAVLLRVASHSCEARPAHWRDHYKHVALFHGGQSNIPFGDAQVGVRVFVWIMQVAVETMQLRQGSRVCYPNCATAALCRCRHCGTTRESLENEKPRENLGGV